MSKNNDTQTKTTNESNVKAMGVGKRRRKKDSIERPLNPKSSLSKKAKLSIKSTQCQKVNKEKKIVNQFSKEGRLTMTAYVEFIMKEWIKYALQLTKSLGRLVLKPDVLVEALKSPWISGHFNSCDFRLSNGISGIKYFDYDFARKMQFHLVSDHTKKKN